MTSTTVRLRVGLAGPDQAWAAGDLYVCDTASAARLIEAGCAVAVLPDGDPPMAPITRTESAMAAPPETAMRPRARARR